MVTISFKHPDLNITEEITTTIESVGKDFVTLESHPDVKIPLEAKQIKDLDLKVGTSVKLEPVTNTFTLTVDAPAPKVDTTNKPGSSPSRTMERLTLD